MDHVTDADRADLERSKEMAAEAKALRRRVLARIRQRKHRAVTQPS